MARSTQPAFTGLHRKIRTWRQKWYYLPDDERAQLRQNYKNNKEAYFAAFRLDEADREYMLESGMAAFVKLEAQLLKTLQVDHYERRAQLACLDLMQNMTQDRSASDLVFVAIDFEGDACRKGVTEFGLARFDLQHLEGGIQGSNIATACRSRRDYLFDNHMRIDIAKLPATIVSNLSDENIILVGHSIHNELANMKHLGVPIEDLPNVIGVVDTFHLGHAEIGHAGTLESLMDALHIPNEPNTFHCAGNDAYYTMQVFLALLVRREELTGGMLNGRVCERLRELAWAKAPLKREIRDRMDEEVKIRELEGFSGFGDLFGDGAECPA